jgi:thiol-disulfide isomerase/thioredoxin
MSIKIIISTLIFLNFNARSQTVSGIYKINDLLERIENTDTTYVINFWATWCKPCVKELPAFDSLTVQKNSKVKVILVSLDFKEDIKNKLKPFLKKNKIKSTCVVLDEVNGNDYINKISEQWSGAIPATFFKRAQRNIFQEKELKFADLIKNIKDLQGY